MWLDKRPLYSYQNDESAALFMTVIAMSKKCDRIFLHAPVNTRFVSIWYIKSNFS